MMGSVKNYSTLEQKLQYVSTRIDVSITRQNPVKPMNYPHRSRRPNSIDTGWCGSDGSKEGR